jgi:hypothetical protein
MNRLPDQFPFILTTLHFIKPDLKPSTTLVSEYAIKPRSWIMQVAFYCMAIGCFAFVLAAWSYASYIGLILLAVVGFGFAGAGIFITDPAFIGKGGQTTSGKLHVFFAFLVIFLFPVMATIVSISLNGNLVWQSVHVWLFVLLGLVWLSLVTFIIVSGLRVNNESAPVGYSERFLVAAYSIWLLVVSATLIL